jgi:methylthioribose-1-phosphate isomerase
VDVAIVGADRVCRNGDTANKVGTYAIGIAAQYHNLPLLIAAPSTSIDCKITDGSFIPIEERPDAEILFNTSGARVVVEGAQTWNPSFDVTSAQLITAVVTEKGVADQKTADGVFNMEEFLQSRS